MSSHDEFFGSVVGGGPWGRRPPGYYMPMVILSGEGLARVGVEPRSDAFVIYQDGTISVIRVCPISKPVYCLRAYLESGARVWAQESHSLESLARVVGQEAADLISQGRIVGRETTGLPSQAGIWVEHRGVLYSIEALEASVGSVEGLEALLESLRPLMATLEATFPLYIQIASYSYETYFGAENIDKPGRASRKHSTP